MPIITYYDFPHAEVFIFDKYLISQVKEGTVLEPEDNDQLRDVVTRYFSDKKFVYIANRVFEYNVNPVTYIETSLIDNLIGMAIVTDTVLGKKTANFEGKFYAKDFKVMDTLEEAINWATLLVDNIKK